MDEVDVFLDRLGQLTSESGLSERKVSMAVTGKPDLIRDCRRNHHLPKGGNSAKLARLFGVSIDYLYGRTDERSGTEAIVADVKLPFSGGSAFEDLPVVGTALGHNLQFEDDGIYVEQMEIHHNDVIRHIQRPPALRGIDKAYGVYIQGDSMYPRFKQGELAVVDARRAVRVGDDVVVQLVGDQDDDGNGKIVCVLVKELVRRSASWIELRQFNPGTTFRIDAARVASLHRIVPIGELLGA